MFPLVHTSHRPILTPRQEGADLKDVTIVISTVSAVTSVTVPSGTESQCSNLLKCGVVTVSQVAP